MPCLEFEISVVLMVCVVGSVVVSWIVRKQKGNIRLPTHVEDEHLATGFAADPFNVTLPEDIVDGYPVDADEFWKRVGAKGVFVRKRHHTHFFLGKLDAMAKAGYDNPFSFCCGYQCFQFRLGYRKQRHSVYHL